MARRSGLGKGLGSLIPAEVVGDRTATLREVAITSVRPSPLQPRRYFAEDALAALAASIREVGVLQPVLVREVEPGSYELIAGERRWRAAKRAGRQTIPVIIQVSTDVHSLEQALVENLHREDLSALEEAAAYQQLLEEFGYTHEQVAGRVGKSRTAVSNTLRLLQAPAGVQRALAEGSITAGHARALLGTPDRALQEELARRVIAEGLSVRAIEEVVRQQTGRPPPEPSQSQADRSPSSVAPEPAAPARTTTSAGEALEEPGGGAANPTSSTPTSSTPTSSTPTSSTPTSRSQVAPGASPPAEIAQSPAPRRLPAPGMLELEELLADRLNTRVKVEMGSRHGRIVIDFATLEDLERIYTLMVSHQSLT